MVDHVNSDNLPPIPPPPPAVDGVVRSPRPSAGTSVPDRIPLHPNHRPFEAYDQPALDEQLLSLSEQVAAMAEAALACIDAADRAATKNEYPTRTLMGLFVQSRMTAHAALQLLQDPFVSYGAAPLVRTMVECWAFSHHIQHGGPGADGAQDTCRALALELGMMRQRSKNFTELFGERLQSSAEARATHAAIQKALKDIDELYKRHGCTCPVTNWTAVRSVLGELRSNHRSPAKQIWLECSMDAHAHAPERMYRKIGETVTMGAPATYQFRFRMLNYVATAMFYQIAATFMCLAAYRSFSPEDYSNVRARFERVRRNQTARESRAGKHDVPA